MRAILTPRDQELLKKLGKGLKHILKIEKVQLQDLTALAGIAGSTTSHVVKGTPVITTSILRIADTLGYEIVFVKRSEKQNLSENPDAVLKLQSYRDYIKKAKRRERGYKDGELPTRTRVNTAKTFHGHMMVQSRRDQIDKALSDDNFLATE